MFEFVTGGPQIMGILNLTPDSFSDGGAYDRLDLALQRACEIEQEGADILDLGAQSTRPGAVAVSPEEELRRLLPVLDVLRGRVTIPVSVDTFYPEVAAAALARGASVINDVSGAVNPEMARWLRHYGGGWVLMHHGGGSVAEVRAHLGEMVEAALGCGLTRGQLCVDPGIGFGDSRGEDLERVMATKELKVPGVAYLVGASRKRVTGEGLPPDRRLPGTIAAHTIAQLGGADILRVHDVAAARQAADLTKMGIDILGNTL